MCVEPKLKFITSDTSVAPPEIAKADAGATAYYLQRKHQNLLHNVKPACNSPPMVLPNNTIIRAMKTGILNFHLVISDKAQKVQVLEKGSCAMTVVLRYSARTRFPCLRTTKSYYKDCVIREMVFGISNFNHKVNILALSYIKIALRQTTQLSSMRVCIAKQNQL